MPVTLSKLTSETATATRAYPDGDLNITYRVRVATPAQFDEMTTQVRDSEDPKAARAMVESFCRVAVKWDLLGKNGKPIPIKADTIYEQVPMGVVIEALDAIKEDQRLGEAKPDSGDG